jgi:transposase-like protein
MGAIAAILLFLHAYGISAKIMEGQYGKAAAIVDIKDAKTGASDTTIAALEKQISEIRLDREAAVASAQASIDGIVNDGIDNDELAEPFRKDQADARRTAEDQIQPLRAEILRLTTDSGATVTEATEDESKTDSFNPLFTFMARVWTGTWNPAQMPSDSSQFVAGVIFFTLFFGFGELLMMMCFPIAYGMQIIVAKQKPKPAQAADGEVLIKMTEQEAAEMQEALAHYAKLREGHVKGGETKSRKNRQDAKRLEANQYMENRKDRVIRMRLTGASVAEIAKKLGVTPSVLGLEMRQWMSDAEYKFVFEGGPNPYGETDEDLAARA